MKEYNPPAVGITHTHFSKNAFGKTWTMFINVQMNYTTICSRCTEETKTK